MAAQALTRPAENDTFESLISSNTIYNGPDLAGNREGRSLTSTMGGHDPKFAKKEHGSALPAPVKVERTVFMNEDIEELDLNKVEETKNVPSKTLMDLQNKRH
jgi:hypothetical protein